MRLSARILALVLLASAPALAGEPTPEERAKAHVVSVTRFFASFGDALRRADGNRVIAHFDVPRLWRELKSWGEVEPMSPAAERDFVRGLREGIRRRFTKGAGLLSWDRQRIVRIEMKPGGEAVVLTLDWLPTGVTRKTRWWLVRHGEGWRLFDLEELDIGIRMTLGAAGMLASTLAGEGTEWLDAQPKLLMAMQLLQGGDWKPARLLLEEIKYVRLPDGIEALRQLALGNTFIQQGRPRDALPHLDRASKVVPDMPLPELLRTAARNQLGEHEAALSHARNYIKMVGEDSEGRMNEAIALLGLDRREEAVQAARTGLTVDPTSQELLVLLGIALPAGGKQELGQRFLALPKPVLVFAPFAEALLERGETEGAEVLVGALRRAAPGDPRADYYAARILSIQGRNEEAAAVLLSGLDGMTDANARENFVLGYVDVMVTMDRPLEAYDGVPVSDLVFHRIGNHLVQQCNGLHLKALVERHRKHAPRSLGILYFEGHIHRLASRHAQAEQLLSRGAALASDAEAKERFREARVGNRFEAGQALQAYAEIGPRRATFRQLGDRYATLSDVKGLKALVGAHAKHDPRDPALPVFAAEVYWIQRDYARMTALLEARADVILTDPANAEHLEDRLIRGLVRQGRHEEARAAAKRYEERTGSPWYVALVHAASGNPAAAERELEALTTMGCAAESFYLDPDLDAALRGKPLAALRKRWPPPDGCR